MFQFWKALTQSRHLWLRATGSTSLSQNIDTGAINLIFWRGMTKRESSWIFAKFGREYGFKVGVAIVLTPVADALRAMIVRKLRIEPEKHEARGAAS